MASASGGRVRRKRRRSSSEVHESSGDEIIIFHRKRVQLRYMAVFYHPCRTGSSGYRTFCTAQACLFVFFLRSIPGLHEHVFLFCIVTSALYCPMGGSMRRRAGVCCFFFFVSVCIFSSSFIRSRWPDPSSGSMLAGTAVELECATGTESLVLRSRFFFHPIIGTVRHTLFLLSFIPFLLKTSYLIGTYQAASFTIGQEPVHYPSVQSVLSASFFRATGSRFVYIHL